MNAEEKIQMLKQVSPDSNFEKKRKVRTAIVLTISTLVSVLFLIYAFVQKLEADKQREIAVKSQLEAEVQRAAAERQREVAEYQRMLAEKSALEAAKALEECRNSKK